MTLFRVARAWTHRPRCMSETLAQSLLDKPGLRLTICTAVPDQEREAWQRERLRLLAHAELQRPAAVSASTPATRSAVSPGAGSTFAGPPGGAGRYCHPPLQVRLRPKSNRCPISSTKWVCVVSTSVRKSQAAHALWPAQGVEPWGDRDLAARPHAGR